MSRANLVGRSFGRLTVLEYVGIRARRRTWRCRCACGAVVSKSTTSLTAGEASSCGCYRRDRIVALSLTHGHTPRREHSRTYVAWRSMRQRCENPKHKSYSLYGARGIRVCPRWREFPNFLADMGEKPRGLTLERINTNGNYEPGNCKWATWSEQRLNQRRMTAPRSAS